MNKKDMIIIAVLLNAGLLAILFMIAVTTDENQVSDLQELTSIIVDLPPLGSEVVETPISSSYTNLTVLETSSATPIDEIDQVLKNYNDSGQGQLVILDEEIDPLPLQIPEQPVEKKEKAPPSTSKRVEVTVKRGDSLDKIARANGSTIKAIKEANQLTSDRLNIGQVLQVPIIKVKKISPTTTKEVAVQENDAKTTPQYYTVKSGDSPWKISKQHNVSVDTILKLNNLNEEKARNLKAGDKIRLR